MILTEAQVASLADRTLARVAPPPGYALVLEGSIAEGFGNSRSDVDFLLVADQDADMPTMPTIFFIDGRRVEIRTRSVGQIAGHLREVAGYAGRSARRIATLDEHLLNRCQRLLHAYVVHRPELVAEVRGNLSHDDFATVMSRWWAEHARQSARHAVLLTTLGEPGSAAVWATAALQQAAKSWAARRGETYLEPKWLSLQLERLDDDPLAGRCRTMLAAVPQAGNIREHLDLVAQLGVTGCADDPHRLVVARGNEVTTWQIDDRVHLVRDRRDVFVLGEDAARVWRRVVWGRPVVDLLADADRLGVPDAGELVSAFHRYGLLRVTWQGTPIGPRLPMAAPLGAITPAPSTATPVLSIAGALPAHRRSIDLLPVPAGRFAAAAMALIWANVMIENAVEDLRGALDQQQWGVAALTTARAVNGGLRALLSAHGVSPLPPDPELLHRLDLVPVTPARIRVLAERLYASAMPDIRLLQDFVTEVRAASGGGAFPSSFDSPDGWQRTLDIGYDWLRLGAYLDQELPLDEAQDLLSSGGVQPHVAAGGRLQEAS
ncbi:hypothetical protein AB0J80_24835 [Actinoplanes sp. NPDC049548]|uniref:hypothetical protein n=1 Tax=Actinoplanes sp. NPDC049548 TaxID=3155152 RepID=UPI00342EDA87